ncbi:aquaporin [Curtobacterium sp. GC_Cur_1]|uniref:aquaporin n=2 Tax=Curtobacterium TaxID=2034 RepID=UPI0035AB9E21
MLTLTTRPTRSTAQRVRRLVSAGTRNPSGAVSRTFSAKPMVYRFGNEGLGYAAVAMVIFVLTIGAGGPTSAAMNPFRDLGPRVIYTIIYRGSGMPSARWDYAWVPIAGPLIGSGLGVIASLLLPANG